MTDDIFQRGGYGGEDYETQYCEEHDIDDTCWVYKQIEKDLRSQGAMVVPEPMSIEVHHGFIPENGWAPADFPQITTAPIPYTTDPLIRPDPRMHINEDGWLYIEVGNVRMALPDREEWAKFVHMGEAMFNTHERKVAAAIAAAEHDSAPVCRSCAYSEAGVVCGRIDVHDHEVNGILHNYNYGGAS